MFEPVDDGPQDRRREIVELKVGSVGPDHLHSEPVAEEIEPTGHDLLAAGI
jgi:hypothetical protein